MSEYQHYEWLAIDRPLTKDQLREVNALSSHMEMVTPTQALVTYEWGNFKHDPLKVLAQYFDAFLYTANWGTRRVAFRLPQAAIDTAALDHYLIPDVLDYEVAAPYVLLNIELSGEDSYRDWVEVDGVLANLANIRRQLMQGDYRALYLVWLALVSERAEYIKEIDEEDPYEEDDIFLKEPPVPNGLQDLDGALTALCEFLGIPDEWVHAAAVASAPLKATPATDLRAALAKLPHNRAEAYLLRLLNEPTATLSEELRRELTQGNAAQAPPIKAREQRRSAKILMQLADEAEQVNKQRAKAAAEKARLVKLENLAAREAEAWAAVQADLARHSAAGYNAAIDQLVDLQSLAEHRGTLAPFQAKLNAVLVPHLSSRALLNRLKKAHLV